LKKNPQKLTILGDGTQSKPYIHVSDVINAFEKMENEQKEFYDIFNVGSTDALTVTEIANIVCNKMKLKDVSYEYSGGNRGWKADVPYYRLNTKKINNKGWYPKFNSLESMELSVEAMLAVDK
jgi:UDP-glucose 4-epimerase